MVLLLKQLEENIAITDDDGTTISLNLLRRMLATVFSSLGVTCIVSFIIMPLAIYCFLCSCGFSMSGNSSCCITIVALLHYHIILLLHLISTYLKFYISRCSCSFVQRSSPIKNRLRRTRKRFFRNAEHGCLR